jgi:hypothetical protein
LDLTGISQIITFKFNKLQLPLISEDFVEYVITFFDWPGFTSTVDILMTDAKSKYHVEQIFTKDG